MQRTKEVIEIRNTFPPKKPTKRSKSDNGITASDNPIVFDPIIYKISCDCGQNEHSYSTFFLPSKVGEKVLNSDSLVPLSYDNGELNKPDNVWVKVLQLTTRKKTFSRNRGITKCLPQYGGHAPIADRNF